MANAGAFLFASVLPAHHHETEATQVTLATALQNVQTYLEASKTAAHLHPDATFTEHGPTYSSNATTGGLILQQLRRVEAGLRGERLGAPNLDILQSLNGLDSSGSFKQQISEPLIGDVSKPDPIRRVNSRVGSTSAGAGWSEVGFGSLDAGGGVDAAMDLPEGDDADTDAMISKYTLKKASDTGGYGDALPSDVESSAEQLVREDNYQEQLRKMGETDVIGEIGDRNNAVGNIDEVPTVHPTTTGGKKRSHEELGGPIDKEARKRAKKERRQEEKRKKQEKRQAKEDVSEEQETGPDAGASDAVEPQLNGILTAHRESVERNGPNGHTEIGPVAPVAPGSPKSKIAEKQTQKPEPEPVPERGNKHESEARQESKEERRARRKAEKEAKAKQAPRANGVEAEAAHKAGVPGLPKGDADTGSPEAEAEAEAVAPPKKDGETKEERKARKKAEKEAKQKNSDAATLPLEGDAGSQPPTTTAAAAAAAPAPVGPGEPVGVSETDRPDGAKWDGDEKESKEERRARKKEQKRLAKDRDKGNKT